MTYAQKEYIVTLKTFEFLEDFYKDIETPSSKIYIPDRAVECLHKRPLSRNTHYLLTDDEARQIRLDPRVESVNVKIKNLSENTNLHASQTGVWSKSSSIAIGQKNWGLYRCQLENGIPGWGSESTSNEETSTININSTGKNVDIIVLDEILYPNHSEFGGRVIQYDWFGQHDISVRGLGTSIANVLRSSNISTITTTAAHGLSDGAIVNIVCTSNSSFNALSVSITVLTTTTFSYTNSGSNVSSTNATGYWTGVYQYDSYEFSNNHTTHVAGIIAGETQGWARESNIYNFRHNTTGINAGLYTPKEYIIDYIRAFHNTKLVNPETGRKNPTIVNNSWGFGIDTAALVNPNTGYTNPSVTKLEYRGNTVVSSASPIDTGFSGVCTNSQLVSDITNMSPGSGNRIETSGISSGTVTSIPFVENGTTGLTEDAIPTSYSSAGVDNNDEAYWNISLPFSISYLTQSYSNVYVSSNSYVTFGSGSFAYIVDQTAPNLRKIHISAGDRNCRSVWSGTFGTTPNRTFIVRWEGYDGAYGGVYEPSPNTIWEMTFYEATPNRIDLQIVTNAMWRGEFTQSELLNYGVVINQQTIPFRDSTVDADIADAIADGIIFVGSAGNSSAKIDVLGGTDYNNYFVDNGLPIYYHRGSSPGASHPDVICVGSIGSTSQESKNSSSNTGPRVDVYAPGTDIISSVYDTTGIFGDVVGSSTAIISGGSAGAGGILSTPGIAVIITDLPHVLTTGQVVTISDCSKSDYNVTNALITVVDSTSFSYSISNTSYSSALELLTGTIIIGYLYEKYTGTSMAAAQITGLLALAAEKYPWMTQSDAKNYISHYAKLDKITETGGGYSDLSSLQGGANKFAFYYKERSEQGYIFPQQREFIRPVAGLVFPRAKIRKR